MKTEQLLKCSLQVSRRKVGGARSLRRHAEREPAGLRQDPRELADPAQRGQEGRQGVERQREEEREQEMMEWDPLESFIMIDYYMTIMNKTMEND